MSKNNQNELEKQVGWLTTWSQAQKGLGLFPINDNGHTVSYRIPLQNNGDKIRLSLGNYYGEAPVMVDAITVSTQQDGGFIPVTVSGEPKVVLKAQEVIKTDEIEVPVTVGSSLYIRLYYPEQAEANRTVSGSIFGLEATRFETGDCTTNSELPVDSTFVDTFENDPYAVKFADDFAQFKQRYTMTIQGVDVHSLEAGCTIVAFGDSITEQNHWVAPLRENLASKTNHRDSLVNAGISGNRLLKQIAGLPRRAQYFGLSGVERFEHDVFEVNTNVSTVIVSLGVNDLHQPGTDVFFSVEELPTVDEMISGYEQLIAIAHKHNSRILLATVSPFIGYAKAVKNDEKEALRNQINDWIRHTDLSDGYFDFNEILANPTDPSRLSACYDSGDKLHPSAEGGKAVSDSMDIKKLLA